MKPTPVYLEFDPALNALGKGKRLTDGLSVVVRIGDSLWVANDETLSLERLTLVEAAGGPRRAGAHTRFLLEDFLRLPVPPSAKLEEADLEGLAYADGYLWLVGSHSLKRKNPKPPEDDAAKIRKKLAKLESDGNRYLLARIPVEERGGSQTLAKKTAAGGERRTAAQLHGDARGNDLTQALRDDEHLGPFLGIPGKDNGFDIEGLAVAGGRIFIGLRGPVLRGWAAILELLPEDDPKDPHGLVLQNLGPGGRPYRKYFLRLNGLGIRDLCVDGEDLLILAGPTMDLDGPVAIFRWPGGAAPKAEAAVSSEELERIVEVPFGSGEDHAEGMSGFSPPTAGSAQSLLVVYDSAAERRRPAANTLTADIFPLPGR